MNAVRWPFTVTPSKPIVWEPVLRGDYVVAHPQLGGVHLVEKAPLCEDVALSPLTGTLGDGELLKKGHGLIPMVRLVL